MAKRNRQCGCCQSRPATQEAAVGMYSSIYLCDMCTDFTRGLLEQVSRIEYVDLGFRPLVVESVGFDRELEELLGHFIWLTFDPDPLSDGMATMQRATLRKRDGLYTAGTATGYTFRAGDVRAINYSLELPHVIVYQEGDDGQRPRR